MTHEALKLALEALEDIANEIYGSWTNGEKAQRIAQNLIPTIKEALAQPQQEPVAIPRFGLNPDNGMMYESKRGPWCLFKDIPPQRKPMIDEQKNSERYLFLRNNANAEQAESAWRAAMRNRGTTMDEVIDRAIEAAHGIKGEA